MAPKRKKSAPAKSNERSSPKRKASAVSDIPLRTPAKRGKLAAPAEETLQMESEKLTSATTFDHLPDEMVETIISFLSLEERKTFRRVSKRCHVISYRPRLIQNDCLHPKDWTGLDQISPASRYVNVSIDYSRRRRFNLKTPFWDRHGRDIKYLSLNYLDGIYPMLPHILSCCPNLESLVLGSFLHRPTPVKVVGEIPGITLSKLQYLEFYCNENTLDVIWAAFTNMPQLRTLIVRGRSDPDRDARLILSLVENTSATLKELNLYFSDRTICNEMFRKIINIVGPQLTGLTIGGYIDDSKLNIITEKCTNLKRFCTYGKNPVPKPSNSAVQRLLTCLRHSTHVSLIGINLETIYFPAVADRMDNLVAINVSGTDISADVLMAAFSVKHYKLERLILDGVLCVNSVVLCRICPNLPNVSHFSLNFIGMDDTMLQTICTFLKKLKFLSIIGPGHVSITVTPLNQLTELIFVCFNSRIYSCLNSLTLPNLRWIETNAFTFTTADIRSLLKNCPLLYKIKGGSDEIDDSLKEILDGRKRASKPCSFLKPFSHSVPTKRSTFPYAKVLLDGY